MPTPIRFVLVHPRTPENLGAAARSRSSARRSGPGCARSGARTMPGRARSPSAPRTCWPRRGLPPPWTRRTPTAAGSWERPGAAGSVRHHWTPRRSPPRPPGGRGAWPSGSETSAGLRRDELACCHALTRIPPTHGSPRSTSPRPSAFYAYAISREPERWVRSAPRPGTDADLRRLEGVLEDVLRTARFVRPGRAGVAPLVDPWRRSGLTRAEIRLWESAIRMLARSLSKLSHDRHLRVQQNS